MLKKVLNRSLLLGLAVCVLWAGLNIKPCWGAPAKTISGVVNINTATEDELALLPGIGKSKAQAIITYRSATPFASVEDFVKVKGIGNATLEKLRPYLTVSGENSVSVQKDGAINNTTKVSQKTDNS